MRALAPCHGINPKTVAKWKNRASTAGRRIGPTVPRSAVLSVEQEAILVAFRKPTLLPLDDCLDALQATIPRLNRSSLHRWLERHGISLFAAIDRTSKIAVVELVPQGRHEAEAAFLASLLEAIHGPTGKSSA